MEGLSRGDANMQVPNQASTREVFVCLLLLLCLLGVEKKIIFGGESLVENCFQSWPHVRTAFMVKTIHSSKGLLSNSGISDRKRNRGAAALTAGNKKSCSIIDTLCVLWHALWE